MSEKLKLMIMGHSNHGKDTVCNMLLEKANYSFKSSGELATELFIFDQLKRKYGYFSAQECHKDRHNHQKEFFDAIVKYNTPNLAKLGSKLLAEYDVYNGVRNIHEFHALKQGNFFDVSIWVDALNRKPPEAASSITVHRDLATIVLDNNGTADQLNESVDTLLWFLPMVKPLLTSADKTATTQFIINGHHCHQQTTTTNHWLRPR